MNLPYLLLAQAPGGGGPGMLVFFLFMAVIMYFMIIRPQQKQLKEHRALIAGLKKGDDVVTQGGLLGKIYAVMDKTVTLEIASGVRVRVLKTSISSKATVSDEVTVSALKPDEKKEEK